MRIASLALLGTVLVACGGSPEPTPSPEPTAAAAAEPAAPAQPEAVDLAAMSDEERLAWLMEEGQKVYTTGGSSGVACVTCHQAEGQGMPGAFPPLAGAGEYMGDCANQASIVINGMSGEIVRGGVTYNGVMPPQGNLKDEEIAAVITYTRNSWGNELGPCSVEDVQAARAR